MRYFAIFALACLFSFNLKAQERFVLAAEDDWYPYSAKRGEQVEGRTVDIVNAAYKAAGATVALDVVPFNRGMELTKIGRYDGVFNASLNESIRREYRIPKATVAQSQLVVVAKIGKSYVNEQSFHGKRLSLTLGYTYPTKITNDPRNKIERAVGDINNLKKVALGHADFTIIDRLVALALLSSEPELKEKLAFVGAFEPDPIYVLFSKSPRGEKARDAFDQGMDKLKASGELQRINKSWEERFAPTTYLK